MEGKGCLFKKFAGIDVFDIELDEHDPDKLVDIIAALEPTFGGINLEDIKAPECFYIERKLRERLKIPVFHDDQHGTAIVAAAAVLNGLRFVGKDIAKAKLVCSGAGAAAIACLDLLVSLGVRRENILVADSKGVVHTGRSGLDESKARYARDTKARTLADAMPGADIFLGLSGPGALTAADGRSRWARSRSSWRWPIQRRRSCRRWRRLPAPTRSSAPAAPIIRTRSTTSSAFPSSSAVRSTWARRRSTRR